MSEPVRIHPFDIAALLDAIPKVEFDAHIESACLPGDGTIVIGGQVYIPDISVPYEHCLEKYERACPREFQNKAAK